ncbi:hypothetical protein ACHAXT_010412 [Thalassiosira profunda]
MISRALIAPLLLLPTCLGWQVGGRAAPPKPEPPSSTDAGIHANPSRRTVLAHAPFLALATLPTIARAAPENAAPNLQFTTTSSGLQYADVKPGSASSPSPTKGQAVSIDYVMSTTGARYGSKIYSTQDAGAPYRWTLGDGSTIPGLEEAVQGMTPGGIRRLIIPSKLAYQSASTGIREECEGGKGLGPIPPASELGEFQRFKNIYCNPDRVYQPDLVLDVKLYGKR